MAARKCDACKTEDVVFLGIVCAECWALSGGSAGIYGKGRTSARLREWKKRTGQ